MLPAKMKKTISEEEWESLIEDKVIPQEGMNNLIMEFLTSEGYGEAAKIFEKESGTNLACDPHSLRVRQEMRATLLQGDVGGAIAVANAVKPEVFTTHPKLMFHVHQQQLIELARQRRTLEALEFARETLAPLAQSNEDFLRELEETVMLLAFDIETAEGPVASLLSLKHRRRLAAELNEALLGGPDAAGGVANRETRLCFLLKLIVWAQDQLRTVLEFPELHPDEEISSLPAAPAAAEGTPPGAGSGEAADQEMDDVR